VNELQSLKIESLTQKKPGVPILTTIVEADHTSDHTTKVITSLEQKKSFDSLTNINMIQTNHSRQRKKWSNANEDNRSISTIVHCTFCHTEIQFQGFVFILIVIAHVRPFILSEILHPKMIITSPRSRYGVSLNVPTKMGVTFATRVRCVRSKSALV